MVLQYYLLNRRFQLLHEDSLEKVAGEVAACKKCRLCESRRNAVPGEGLSLAKAMFIGEAPGEQEDIQGRPFVGSAGKLLTELLKSVGLKRDEVFITNTVKCRPPNNRAPRTDESSACQEYLQRQLRLVNPRIICPMGNSAIRTIMNLEQTVSQIHGVPFEIEASTFFPMYHPAAALYTSSLRKVMEDDFQKLRGLIDSLN